MKRNFDNPSGTRCFWHIFTAFIKLIRIIKWKNFALNIFRFWLFLQLLVQNLFDPTSLSLSRSKIIFLGETPHPDFPFNSLYIYNYVWMKYSSFKLLNLTTKKSNLTSHVIIRVEPFKSKIMSHCESLSVFEVWDYETFMANNNFLFLGIQSTFCKC